jgi:hypothetical protein
MRPADHAPSQRRNRRPRRAHVTLAAAVALSALIAGCGGGRSNPGVANLGPSGASDGHAPSSAPYRSTYQQALAYANCVRHHGVPLWPDPDSGGRFDKSELTPRQLGVGRIKAGEATAACKSLLPSYPAAEQSHVLAHALRFSHCMRAHGSTSFPDPQSNGAIRIPHAMESSPTYLAALRYCIHRCGVPPPPTPAGGS